MREIHPGETKQISYQVQLRAAIEAIGVSTKEGVFDELEQEIISAVESAMLESVRGVPEELAGRTKTIDAAALNTRAQEIVDRLKEEPDRSRRSELQVELIYQYIALISQVQGSGQKAFTPALAREIGEMDCTLSTWSLKEKLHNSGVQDVEFSFGYPSDHAVGIAKLADGRNLYVDAQNGFAAEIELHRVTDPNVPVTAYPMYEIVSHRRISANMLNDDRLSAARPEGSARLPKYLGVRKDGVLHTLGNMYMFMNSDSPVYATATAMHFRQRLEEDSAGWAHFEEMLDKVAGGKVIQETKFGGMDFLAM